MKFQPTIKCRLSFEKPYRQQDLAKLRQIDKREMESWPRLYIWGRTSVLNEEFEFLCYIESQNHRVIYVGKDL